jgi:hypothetical protein
MLLSSQLYLNKLQIFMNYFLKDKCLQICVLAELLD